MVVKIPYALDDKKNLIKIDEAEKKNKYFCPYCHVPVIVRKGNIRVHHFAHKSNDVCSQETAVHKIAKLLIQKRITNWKNNRAPSPQFYRHCQICNQKEPQPLPNKVEKADLEVLLPNGYIIDVALMSEEIPIAAIEIKVTHAVDNIKASSLSIPFVEIDGFEVLNHEHLYNPLRDHFKPYTCSECKKRLRNYIDRARKYAQKINLQLPESYYRYRFSKCWRCKEFILVFTWPNHQIDDVNKPTKLPIPHTIQCRNFLHKEKPVWANCCPFCNSPQNDAPLYKYNGVLSQFECKNDTKEDFEIDMMKMLFHKSFL